MVSTARVEDNLSIAESLIRGAAGEGAEFVLLPENFSLISDDETDKLKIAETYGAGPIQDFLKDQAKIHGLWLMGGTIPLKSREDSRVFNSCLFYDPQGDVTARYEKIHLFDVSVNDKSNESYNESNTIVPGNEIVVAQSDFARIGMSVCYDLRFPELYRRLMVKNIDVITVPSAFTYATGKHHWEFLLKARAVENLSYVIASNQGGQNTDRRSTWGHSMIISPWGAILACIQTGPGYAVADLDFKYQENLRKSFPAIQHIKII
jgi:nitrilase